MGRTCVEQPSPGLMSRQPTSDPLDAWLDCYEMKPKRRIKLADAKREIQRAWENWEGDKEGRDAIRSFYGWLWRFRPFFLTFRGKRDPWWRVHSWIVQYEDGKTER